MLFSSIVFIWIFLPCVLLGNFILQKAGGNKAANILLLIVWYIAFAVISLGKQDTLHAVMAVGIPASFPAVSIILYVMARHGIIADEKLVRSMDRIR